MKKRQMTIVEYEKTTGVHTILINNARYQKGFLNVVEKFCRTDGVNLTLKQQKRLENEIPAFFQKNGDFQNLSEYLTAAKIKLNNDVSDYIALIFDYYLETVMFSPKIDWENFKQYYSEYQEHRVDEIILNHFAEILFYYFDSGDLMICFNPQVYSSQEVRSMVERSFE